MVEVTSVGLGITISVASQMLKLYQDNNVASERQTKNSPKLPISSFHAIKVYNTNK